MHSMQSKTLKCTHSTHIQILWLLCPATRMSSGFAQMHRSIFGVSQILFRTRWKHNIFMLSVEKVCSCARCPVQVDEMKISTARTWTPEPFHWIIQNALKHIHMMDSGQERARRLRMDDSIASFFCHFNTDPPSTLSAANLLLLITARNFERENGIELAATRDWEREREKNKCRTSAWYGELLSVSS